MTRPNLLKGTALFIALVQLILGLGYLFAPAPFHRVLGLEGLPAWAGWPFGMTGARFLAFAFGMLQVARKPWEHRVWIQAMVGVQLIDWLATMKYLLAGTLTLAQVSTASFLPLVFIALLLIAYPAHPEGYREA